MAEIRRLLILVIGLVTGVRVVGGLAKGAARRATTALTTTAPPASTTALTPAQPKRSKNPTQARPIGAIAWLKELFQRFGRDHCGAWAASLSFFSILSIVPVLLCGLAILGFVIQDPAEAARQVQRIIANLLPGAGAQATARQLIQDLKIQESAKSLMEQRGIAAVIGIGSLFWSASQIILNAITPMNAAFGTEETRGFIKVRLVAFGLMIGAGLLFLLSLVPASGAQLINAIHIPGVGRLPDPLPPLIAILFSLIGVAVNAVMFTVLYRYLPSPSARVEWRAARDAGMVVAVLWEIAKQGFAFYLRQFGQSGYNKMYGSLGGLVALIFWIYYSSMILLLGAEIAKLISDHRNPANAPSETPS